MSARPGEIRPKCYFCNGVLPNMPWYYRIRKGLSVKICDRCYAERENDGR